MVGNQQKIGLGDRFVVAHLVAVRLVEVLNSLSDGLQGLAWLAIQSEPRQTQMGRVCPIGFGQALRMEGPPENVVVHCHILASPTGMELDYQLLDFGRGRKLERFGPWLIDRPAPAAESVSPCEIQTWHKVTGAFRHVPKGGDWWPREFREQTTVIAAGPLLFELAPTKQAQLGLFAEQQPNWHWLSEQARRATADCQVLHLFAYTGASSLALAAAGARVVHVDAARSAVSWAKRNAARSQLAAAPIRWIVDDARAFVGREARRGNRYHGLVLDPPTYGHGPRGEAWRLDRDLVPLLLACREILEPDAWVLCSAHATGLSSTHLAERIHSLWPRHELGLADLSLTDRAGRVLPAGVTVRAVLSN